MRRREFIFALGGAAVVWPRTMFAQSADRAHVIGWLSGVDPNDPLPQTTRAAFTKELSHLGWVEGQNLRLEVRGAGGDPIRARALAKELVELRPDLIVAGASLSLGALVRETRTIPIVFVGVSNPIEQGYVTNLTKPGGNVTGFANQPELSLAAKWVEILKEIVPNVSRIALMNNPGAFYAVESMFGTIEAAATSFGLEATRMPIYKTDQIEASVSEFASKPNRAIIVSSDSFLSTHRDAVIRAMANHRLPAAYGFGFWAREGGLIAYGNDFFEHSRLLASYVDRILRGDKPGDLPVQQPTKFELVVNLKTAKALNLTIPPSLLARADEVIE
jgi:putative tryptophan/tyrosine transport system substrate-binding protein